MAPEGSTENQAVPASGRLDGITFPDLLWGLCCAGKTGTLRVGPPEAARTLFLDRGKIVQAASEVADDRIGPRLLRRGLVTLDQLEQAVNRSNVGQRLDSLLVEAGALTPDQLVEGVRDQVRGVVFDLFDRERGDYQFTEGPVPVFAAPVDVDARSLILDGARRARSLRRLRRRVGSPSTIWALDQNWDERLAGLDLGEREQLLLDRLACDPASLDDLFHELLLSNFEIYQALWALQILGVALRIGVLPGPADDPKDEDRDSQGFVEHLLHLCSAGETGLLVARNEGLERSFHLRNGRCVFATSSNPDDALLAFLLRKGVISLRDADEAIRRMLTNKRMGTILLELGVIDDTDLHLMVREQVTDIVCDTFTWERGEFAFITGTLPSDEAITIELDLEALVMSGLRRVHSWSRVRHGLEGLDSTFALTPEYLDILDRMLSGEEEWSVVTAIKEPRTVREICRSTELGDFETCRVLWGLRLLGAVEVTDVAGDGDGLVRMMAIESEAAQSGMAAAESEPSGVEQVAEAVDESAEDAEVDAAAETEEEAEVEAATEFEEDADVEALAESEDDAEFEDESEIDAEIEIKAKAEFEEDAEFEAEAEPEEAESALEAEVEFDSAADDGQLSDPTPSAEEAEPTLAGSDVDEHAETTDSENLELERTTRTIRVSAEDLASAVAGAPPDDAVEASSIVRTVEIDELDEPDELDEMDLADDDAESPPVRDVGPHEPVAAADAIHDESAAGGEAVPSAAGEEVRAEPSAESPATVVDDWEPPEDLDDHISRFNTIQRVIYRVARTEIGAGATNFIRSCCGSCDGHEMLASVELHSDGTWDADGLRDAVIEQRIEDPWQAYERVIAGELDLLTQHVGEVRTADLRRRIERVDDLARR